MGLKEKTDSLISDVKMAVKAFGEVGPYEGNKNLYLWLFVCIGS